MIKEKTEGLATKVVAMSMTAITIVSLSANLFVIHNAQHAYKRVREESKTVVELKNQLAVNQRARARQFDMLMTLSKTQTKAFNEANAIAADKSETELMYQLLHLEALDGVKPNDQVSKKGK